MEKSRGWRSRKGQVSMWKRGDQDGGKCVKLLETVAIVLL